MSISRPAIVANEDLHSQDLDNSSDHQNSQQIHYKFLQMVCQEFWRMVRNTIMQSKFPTKSIRIFGSFHPTNPNLSDANFQTKPGATWKPRNFENLRRFKKNWNRPHLLKMYRNLNKKHLCRASKARIVSACMPTFRPADHTAFRESKRNDRQICGQKTSSHIIATRWPWKIQPPLSIIILREV